MSHTPDNYDPQARRAGVRRTVWITTAIAIGLFVMIILKGVLG